MSDEPTSEGKHLIQAWQDAVESLDRTKQQVNAMECDLANCINRLGKWMLPGDAKEDEAFCVWWGDNLIEVINRKPKHSAYGDYEITVRKRGKRGF